ncbi:hypothetical protein PEBR_14665 [Penicillium brasilianum]|uniref:DDE-1 domain-containing protein n=1 Tax=Penicillium brasilianum TaxID=104259 RepID=A0A1S9RR90_PENBI|nr:hypothetical protein PEBR_14665 [Penicillium brasilianum]
MKARVQHALAVELHEYSKAQNNFILTEDIISVCAGKADKVDENGIQPEDIYNFDETGFAMGLISTQKVVTRAGICGRPRLLQSGNREWVTTVEAIGADGYSLPLCVIFKAKVAIASWFDNIPKDWRIEVSSNGWTTDEIGLPKQSTVYVTELNGIEIAVANFANQPENQRRTKIVIFSDSQAAIQAGQTPKRSLDQYVLLTIYDYVRALRSRTPTFDQIPVEIRWIPAHLAATRGMGSGADQLPAGGSAASGSPSDRVLLASTVKRRVRRRIKERWAQKWAREAALKFFCSNPPCLSIVPLALHPLLQPLPHPLQTIHPSPLHPHLPIQKFPHLQTTGKPNQRLVKAPDKKVLRPFESLSKPYTSILIQIRSMRIAPNHFLFKIKAVELDKCCYSEGSQTPRHILMQCPLYADLRKTFLDKVRATNLGDSTDYDAIVSHSQATPYIAEFMLQTGHLGQFRHVEIEPEPPEGGDENNKPE